MFAHFHTYNLPIVHHTAIEGDDFTPLSKEIIFNADTSPSRAVYIPIINDDCVEYDEYFFVDLSTSLSCVNLVNDSVNITIEDDDCELSDIPFTSMHNNKSLLFIVGTGAHFGLESDFFEVRENASSLNICAVLKDPIKRNITLYLTISGGTAIGKKCDHNTMCVCM